MYSLEQCLVFCLININPVSVFLTGWNPNRTADFRDRSSKWSRKCTNEPSKEETRRQNPLHPTYKHTAENKPDTVVSTYQRNNDARSRYHFCLEKAVIITYSECVSVGLIIQHAMRMRRIVVCSLSGSTLFFHIISERKRFSGKVTRHKMYFDFLYHVFLSGTFPILKIIKLYLLLIVLLVVNCVVLSIVCV